MAAVQSGAESGPLHGGNHRLGAARDKLDHAMKRHQPATRTGWVRSLGNSHLPDVSTSGEIASRAGDDNGTRALIRHRALERFQQRSAHLVRQGIEVAGRVERQDSDIVACLVGYSIGVHKSASW